MVSNYPQTYDVYKINFFFHLELDEVHGFLEVQLEGVITKMMEYFEAKAEEHFWFTQFN
jgi:hypothetical protein